MDMSSVIEKTMRWECLLGVRLYGRALERAEEALRQARLRGESTPQELRRLEESRNRLKGFLGDAMWEVLLQG